MLFSALVSAAFLKVSRAISPAGLDIFQLFSEVHVEWDIDLRASAGIKVFASAAPVASATLLNAV